MSQVDVHRRADVEEEPLIRVENLKKHYPITKGLLGREVGRVKAVDGLTFEVAPGETFGLVGESGCGKSTAAESLLRLEEPTAGNVYFDGEDITEYDDESLKRFRREAQMIFQNPASSFDPRMSIGESVSEPLRIHGVGPRERRLAIARDLLERVGLEADDVSRYPHELSGGQKQRVALARALVVNPRLIVADEPVSALDVSVQAEVLSLLEDVQEEFGLSILFISHDMSVIREVCDRVAVMYLGEIVEVGRTEEIFDDPRHPYTRALLGSIPTIGSDERSMDAELRGEVPDPSNPPEGCRFHPRCPEVIQPEGYEFEQENWRGVMELRVALRRGTLDVDAAEEFTVAEYDVDESEVDREDVESVIREEYNLPDSLTDSSAESVLTEAFDHLFQDDAEAARELLAREFETICERRHPTSLRMDDYSISREEWEGILSLHESTAFESSDLEEIRQSNGSVPDDELRDRIREVVGLDDQLGDPDAEETVSRAVDAVVDGDDDRASAILYEAFAESHSAACHLEDDTVRASSSGIGERAAGDD